MLCCFVSKSEKLKILSENAREKSGNFSFKNEPGQNFLFPVDLGQGIPNLIAWSDCP